MTHSKVYDFLTKNKETITLSFLITVLFEILMHEFKLAAGIGLVGLILNSHLFCCLLPFGLTFLFHKKDCGCHVHKD